MLKKLEDLPTELLEHIVFFLDVDPPSVAQNAQEPSLQDLFTTHTPLKALAQVSSSWRRMVDPLIFKYLRVSVAKLQGLAAMEQELLESQEEQRKAKLLQRVHTWQSRQWVDPLTRDKFYASMKALSSDGVILERYDKTELSLAYADLAEADEHYVSMMTNHVQDQLSQAPSSRVSPETCALERFFQARASLCSSLLVYSHQGYEKNFDTAGHHVPQRAKIWNLTKRYINPSRLVLIAPPELLARLAHCFTNVTDLWSFHIPFQRIELHQYSTATQYELSDQRKTNYEDAETDMNGYGLLHARYWQSFEYDEGSSLNIYGTYHYFEKQPPSIINLASTHIESLGSWLRDFTYTSIFPHHAHFVKVIEAIEGFKALMHLRLKLAPDQSSKLLADDERIARGNLSLRDCWNELERCYESFCQRLLSSAAERALPILQRFTSLDYQNPWLEEKLETLRFELLPDWTRAEDGSWKPVIERPGFRNWAAVEEQEKAEVGVEVQEVASGSSAAAAAVTALAWGHYGLVEQPSMFGAYDP